MPSSRRSLIQIHFIRVKSTTQFNQANFLHLVNGRVNVVMLYLFRTLSTKLMSHPRKYAQYIQLKPIRNGFIRSGRHCFVCSSIAYGICAVRKKRFMANMWVKVITPLYVMFQDVFIFFVFNVSFLFNLMYTQSDRFMFDVRHI